MIYCNTMGVIESLGSAARPPIEWFTAFGDIDAGITHVTVNDAFFGLDGYAAHHFNNWRNQMLIITSPNSSPKAITKAGGALSREEGLFLRSTGFSPRDILSMADELTRQYRGKKEAPIETRLLR